MEARPPGDALIAAEFWSEVGAAGPPEDEIAAIGVAAAPGDRANTDVAGFCDRVAAVPAAMWSWPFSPEE